MADTATSITEVPDTAVATPAAAHPLPSSDASGLRLIATGASLLGSEIAQSAKSAVLKTVGAARTALTSAKSGTPSARTRSGSAASRTAVLHARTPLREKYRSIAIGLVLLALLYVTVLHGPVHTFTNYVHRVTHPSHSVAYVPGSQNTDVPRR